MDPVAWHEAALSNPSLGDAAVVQGAMLLQPQILPRTGETAKQIFTSEVEGITTVGLNPAISEYAARSSSLAAPAIMSMAAQPCTLRVVSCSIQSC